MRSTGREKQGTMDQEQGFTADVKIAGINPYVDVPERVVDAMGSGTKAGVARLRGSGSGARFDRDE
jgi:hypothetical protein